MVHHVFEFEWGILLAHIFYIYYIIFESIKCSRNNHLLNKSPYNICFTFRNTTMNFTQWERGINQSNQLTGISSDVSYVTTVHFYALRAAQWHFFGTSWSVLTAHHWTAGMCSLKDWWIITIRLGYCGGPSDPYTW